MGWPPWAYAGEDQTFENRFDDPAGEYRVLYASSPRLGAFLETLARYRTDPALLAEYDEIAIDPEDSDRYPTIPPGVVPAGWCSSRARHDGPFADIGQSRSLAELRLRSRAGSAITALEISLTEAATLADRGFYLCARYLPQSSSFLTFSTSMTTESSTDVMADFGILEAREVAKLLKLRHSTVLDLSRRGILPAFKIGKHRRYRRADLEEWMASRHDTA